MPESTEPAPENNKAKQTAYLVCEGALCQCAAGAAPVKLKVTSHKKAYINNNKLLATEKDVTFDEQGHFGTCSFKVYPSNACAPAVQQWLKPYKDIEVENNKVLTDQSQLMCSTGGTITIKMHGQQQTVNAGQAENMDRTIATQVNPLADLAPLAEAGKKVKVNSITGELVDDPKYKPVTTQKVQTIKSVKESDTDKDPSDIRVRPGQEIKFTAQYEGTEPLVCWKLQGKAEPIYFLQHGPVYKTGFPEVGKYVIEGYGTGIDSNLDVDTQINKDNKRVLRGTTYTECMLDILVQNNKLIGIRHLESKNIIPGKVDNKAGIHVRIGVPVTFEPIYLMAPIQEEIDHLILVIKDASGNEVQRSKGAPNIVFAAQNSAVNYKVEAYFDNSEAAPFTYPFRTAHNTVSVVAASGLKEENDKIRPGTKLTFSVSKFKFADEELQEEVLNAELDNIRWYENADAPVAIGKTTYSNTYQKEGEYIVTCSVKAKSAGWFTLAKNKDEADDWHFKVTRNYPTAIEKKTEGKVKVGKKITFELKGIFEIDHTDAATITWQLTGPDTITTKGSYAFVFTPRKNGAYVLTATMNGQSKDFDFECITCEIVKGWWTDADGNILTGKDDEEEPKNTIGFAGWEQEVVAAFKHVGLNDEDVTLEVFQKNTVFADVSVFKKDIKVMGTGNGATCSVKLDTSLKDKIKNNSAIGSEDALLYFTVKAKNGLKVINDGMMLPESGSYLNVDGDVRIKTYFADNNDTRRYSTASLDTPVYIQIKSTNLIGEDLELEIWKSIDWESDKALGSRFTFKVDKYGMASLKLNMKLIKPELPTPKDSVSIYVKIYNKNTRTELTGEFTFKLTMYKTLATSASSIGTTKAFVVVDASKLEKSEFKVCECEARVRAFMRMLRVGEGTEGDKGYTTLFGNQKFTDMSSHPQKIVSQSGYSSSAAGAYQIMGYTYKWLNGVKLNANNKDSGIYEENHDYIKKYSINDFSPNNQDRLCVVIFKHKRKGLIELIIKGEIQKALEDYGSYEWASLPPGRYGQPTQTMEKALQKFEEFLKLEKAENSDLKIEKEFLNDFGYSCKCEKVLINRKSSSWSNPLEYSERTYFNSLGIHKEQNGAFGPVRLNNDGTAKNHQGLDLFAIPGTACKACLDGEIVSYSNEGDDGYGNVLVLKVQGDDLRKAKNNYVLEFSSVEKVQGENFDINAKEFYLRYAHLKSAVKTSGNVKSGEIICYTGESGNANGVPNPHLHFEVAMKKSGNGSGLLNRYNPAFFVKLNTIKISSQTAEKNKREK